MNFPSTSDCQASNSARMSVATPGDLSSSVKEQYGHTGERPAKGHKDNEAPHIRGRRTRTVQPSEEKAQGGNDWHTQILEERAQSVWSWPLSSHAQWLDQMWWAQHETQWFLLKIRKHFLHCEDDQALAQVAQGSCSFLHWRNSETTKTQFWVSGSKRPCLKRGIGPNDFQRCLPASVILWGCEAGILPRSGVSVLCLVASHLPHFSVST